MYASKEQIIKGLIAYVRDDVKPMITNSNFRFVLNMAISALEVNPALADSILENQFVKTFSNETGEYDIDKMCVVLTNAVNESGGFKMEVPAIPVLLPSEQMIVLAQDDIERLFNRIRGN